MTIKGTGARKGWVGKLLFRMGNTQRIKWERIAVDAEYEEEAVKKMMTGRTKVMIS